nr:hypothetical protein [Streptomyces californicus]
MTRPVPANAADARDAVMRLLTTQFCGPVSEGLAADVVVADALLVTSELVTNAVRHGGGITGFAAELTDEGLRLTVMDASRELPVDSADDSARPCLLYTSRDSRHPPARGQAHRGPDPPDLNGTFRGPIP